MKKKESKSVKQQHVTRPNHFETLNKQVECCKCNNFWHTAKECRSNWTIFTKRTNYHHEDYGMALQAQNKEEQWCVDSGCSTHMTGDKNKFITLSKTRQGLLCLEMTMEPTSLVKA